MYVCIYIHMYAYVYIYICVCVYVCVCMTCSYTHLYTCIYTHVNLYIYIYTQDVFFPRRPQVAPSFGFLGRQARSEVFTKCAQRLLRQKAPEVMEILAWLEAARPWMCFLFVQVPQLGALEPVSFLGEGSPTKMA